MPSSQEMFQMISKKHKSKLKELDYVSDQIKELETMLKGYGYGWSIHIDMLPDHPHYESQYETVSYDHGRIYYNRHFCGVNDEGEIGENVTSRPLIECPFEIRQAFIDQFNPDLITITL